MVNWQTLTLVMDSVARAVEVRILTPNQARKLLVATARMLGLGALAGVWDGDVVGGDSWPLSYA